MRSRVERALGLAPPPLDEMGRVPRQPAPCPPLLDLLRAYGEGGAAPDVLLFGDSTAVLVSPSDLSRQTLPAMIERRIRPWHALSIAGVAYHPGVYSALAGALESMPGKPSLVVVPVNVRQFSPEWVGNPNTAHHALIEAIEAYRADPTAPVQTVPAFPSGNLLRPGPNTDEWREFLATPVAYPGRQERTVGDFVASLSHIPPAGEGRADWISTAFAFHFLFPLGPDNPRLRALKQTIARAQEFGAAVLVYVAPANHEAGIEFAGREFDTSLATKVETIRRACLDAAQDGSVAICDWSRLLRPADFFVRDELLSHMNERGRSKLAAQVANEIRELLASRSGSAAS